MCFGSDCPPSDVLSHKKDVKVFERDITKTFSVEAQTDPILLTVLRNFYHL